MPPKRLLEPPASPEVKSASPKRRRRGAARGGARRGTPKRNARGLFEVGLAIEDMVRDVEAANDLFPDEPCGEHEPCGEDDDCGGPLSENAFVLSRFWIKTDQFTKTGSGQT